MRTCRHCEDEFDERNQMKQEVGGYIDECPWCVEERGGDDSPPKYLGVQGGDGKMAGITILAFEDNASREAYKRAWSNNTGMNKGKSCHLSGSNTAMHGMRFKKIGENMGNSNHKGKL